MIVTDRVENDIVMSESVSSEVLMSETIAHDVSTLEEDPKESEVSVNTSEAFIQLKEVVQDSIEEATEKSSATTPSVSPEIRSLSSSSLSSSDEEEPNVEKSNSVSSSDSDDGKEESAPIIISQPTENGPNLVHTDSKSRLYQTVQDAHEIKVTPVGSPPRRQSLGSPVSLEIPVIPPVVSSDHLLYSPSSPPQLKPVDDEAPEIIEITETELDDVMMSHRQFLMRQAQTVGFHSDENKNDKWVTVDGKGLYNKNKDKVTVNSDSHNGEELSNGPVSYKIQFDANGTDVLKNSVEATKLSNAQQKSMTHITLSGPQYTVKEGSISRTVIISNPELSGHLHNETNNPDSPPPNLQPLQ